MKIFALILLSFHPVEGVQLAIVPVDRCPTVLNPGPNVQWVCLEIITQPFGEPA